MKTKSLLRSHAQIGKSALQVFVGESGGYVTAEMAEGKLAEGFIFQLSLLNCHLSLLERARQQ